jgi:predicted membrane protein
MGIIFTILSFTRKRERERERERERVYVFSIVIFIVDSKKRCKLNRGMLVKE